MLPQPEPSSDNRPNQSRDWHLHSYRAKKSERRRTAALIRETDVAPLSALGVGQVDVVLWQTLLAIVPFVEAWWLFAAFRLRETVQIIENVFGGGVEGKVVVMKEESDGGEDEESEEVAAQTTR